MKTLNQYIKESILDDEEDIISSAPEVLVRDFISENYEIYGKITINKVKDKYIVDCNGEVEVKNRKIKQLTNGLFEWGAIKKYFDCSDCTSLKDLTGAPEKVGSGFYCSGCTSLKDLTGAPEKISGNFGCSNCTSLKDLTGAPKEVGGDFSCRVCTSLTSLEGAPIEVGGYFDCKGCRVKFTKKDVEKVSNVKRLIIV